MTLKEKGYDLFVELNQLLYRTDQVRKELTNVDARIQAEARKEAEAKAKKATKKKKQKGTA